MPLKGYSHRLTPEIVEHAYDLGEQLGITKQAVMQEALALWIDRATKATTPQANLRDEAIFGSANDQAPNADGHQSMMGGNDGKWSSSGESEGDARSTGGNGDGLSRDAGQPTGHDLDRRVSQDADELAGRDVDREAEPNVEPNAGRDLDRKSGPSTDRDVDRDAGRDVERDVDRNTGRDAGRNAAYADGDGERVNVASGDGDGVDHWRARPTTIPTDGDPKRSDGRLPTADRTGHFCVHPASVRRGSMCTDCGRRIESSGRRIHKPGCSCLMCATSAS